MGSLQSWAQDGWVLICGAAQHAPRLAARHEPRCTLGWWADNCLLPIMSCRVVSPHPIPIHSCPVYLHPAPFQLVKSPSFAVGCSVQQGGPPSNPLFNLLIRMGLNETLQAS